MKQELIQKLKLKSSLLWKSTPQFQASVPTVASLEGSPVGKDKAEHSPLYCGP